MDAAQPSEAALDRVRRLCLSWPEVTERLSHGVGHRGWLGVFLDVSVEWDMAADIIGDAYHTIAGRGR